MNTDAQRLERIAAQLDRLAIPHENFATTYGSREEAEEGKAYRRAAAIIRNGKESGK